MAINGLRASDFVLTDAFIARLLPADCPAHVFRIIAEALLNELRRLFPKHLKFEAGDLQEHLRLKPFAFVVVVAAVVLTWTLTELALSIRCWRLAPNFS